jgi:hypothetical protein
MTTQIETYLPVSLAAISKRSATTPAWLSNSIEWQIAAMKARKFAEQAAHDNAANMRRLEMEVRRDDLS